MPRHFLILLSLCCLSYSCEAAPNYNLAMYPERNLMYAYGPQPRPLGSIGDWITGSSWFPIEVNVPDAISSITNSLSGITGTISSGIAGISGVAQRFPFFHQLISQERPRPLPYLILVPTQPNLHRPQFNPFLHETEGFPHYP